MGRRGSLGLLGPLAGGEVRMPSTKQELLQRRSETRSDVGALAAARRADDALLRRVSARRRPGEGAASDARVASVLAAPSRRRVTSPTSTRSPRRARSPRPAVEPRAHGCYGPRDAPHGARATPFAEPLAHRLGVHLALGAPRPSGERFQSGEHLPERGGAMSTRGEHGDGPRGDGQHGSASTERWNTGWGAILAVAGSAVGLGNL